MKRGILTNSRMVISKNYGPKYPIKAILVPNLRIFIFGRNFVLGKIEGADVKYHSTVAFWNSSPKIPK